MPDPIDALLNSNAYNRRSTVISTNANMSMEDFYKIMSAQLRYQDPSKPADSTDMLNQMTQMAMISTIENVKTMAQTSYATSMMGKTVIVAKTESGTNKLIGEETGVVTGVNLSAKEMTVWVNGQEYKLSSIMQIGGKEAPKATNNNANSNTSNTSTTTGNAGTSNTSGTTNTTNTGNSGASSSSGVNAGNAGSTNNSVPSNVVNNGTSTSTLNHLPASNTSDPKNAMPPMTVITNEDGSESRVPVYSMKENDDKLIVPVG